MAASINDYFNLVNNGALAEPAQLAANKQTTDTTASLTLATGWPTATAVHLALFKTNTDGTVDDSTVTYWKATLAGTTLSDMTLKGGTNQAYTTGDSAVILSPYQFNDLVNGILVQHNQDGTHKDITTDNLTVSSNVNLPNGSIDTAALAESAVTSTKLAEAFLRGRLQEITTNTAPTGLTFQHGWGFINQGGVNEAQTSVTFPTAFSSAPVVLTSIIGTRTSNPTSITDFTNQAERAQTPIAVIGLSTTGFTARSRAHDTSFFSANLRLGFTWIAIGTV